MKQFVIGCYVSLLLLFIVFGGPYLVSSANTLNVILGFMLSMAFVGGGFIIYKKLIKN